MIEISVYRDIRVDIFVEIQILSWFPETCLIEAKFLKVLNEVCHVMCLYFGILSFTYYSTAIAWYFSEK